MAWNYVRHQEFLGSGRPRRAAAVLYLGGRSSAGAVRRVAADAAAFAYPTMTKRRSSSPLPLRLTSAGAFTGSNLYRQLYQLDLWVSLLDDGESRLSSWSDPMIDLVRLHDCPHVMKRSVPQRVWKMSRNETAFCLVYQLFS